MIFDPVYMIIMLLALVLGGVTSAMVKGAFAKYSKVPASSGVTGAEAARQMLRSAGLDHVGIERVGGFLSDHYDPRAKVLRLSPDVYDGRSVASLGVACHEAGHAIQDAKNYGPLVVRNAAVPVASFGSNAAFIFIILGLMLGFMNLAIVGVLLFACVVFFQLVNLPVEFDASNRAKKMLPQLGLISGAREQAGVDKVLNAAAMTYVAGTVVAVMQLVYFALLVLNRR